VALERSPATLANDAEFAAFACCGTEDAPWIREAENYVRAWALRRSEHCLAFRDAGELVAASAFDASVLGGFPLVEPVDRLVWHLNVVAMSAAYQRQGLSSEVFRSTFEVMRDIDPRREDVTANVHREHTASLAACSGVGLEFLMPLDDDYVLLFGPVS